MERIKKGYSELISAGLSRIPGPILTRLGHIDFFTGTSPIFAGLFDYKETDDGRSYKETWCVCYPHHLSKLPKALRKTTVVLPNLIPDYPLRLRPLIVVHEIGHILDELLGFRWILSPVTKYARTDREEAFAEAFTLWVAPEYAEFYKILHPLKAETRYIFGRFLTQGDAE